MGGYSTGGLPTKRKETKMETAIRNYIENNVDSAIEYAKNNPTEYMDTAHHAATLMMIEIIKGMTGMSDEELEAKLVDKMREALN